MTGWAIIPDSDVDAESPITESLMFRLRDNSKATFEGDASVPDADLCTLENQRTDSTTLTDVLQPDGLNKWTLGPIVLSAASVGQAELKTAVSTFTVSNNSNSAAGEYGFYPQLKDNGSHSGDVVLAGVVNIGTSFVTRINRTSLLSGTVTTQQRYVTASKPYYIDKNDGEIHLFVFLLMNGNNIKEVWIAEDPPWAYNGPTRTRPDEYKRNKQGLIDRILFMNEYELKVEKYKRLVLQKEKDSSIIIPDVDDIYKFSQQQVNEYLDEKIKVPVDMDRKNKDMDLIKYPWGEIESTETVLLLDPPDTGRLLEMHNAKVDLIDFLLSGYIQITNESINRATPEGVTPVKFKWKDTI